MNEVFTADTGALERTPLGLSRGLRSMRLFERATLSVRRVPSERMFL
jgi:hypothetical protein